MTKSFLTFIDNYEKELDDFVSTDTHEQEDQPVVVQEKKVVPKPVIKKTVKESSTLFSFCAKCGKKSPFVQGGIFCPFCGQQSLKNTSSSQQTSGKKIVEDVDYANSLLDDTPRESSRLMHYLSKQSQKNPLQQAIIQSQTIQSMNASPISETTNHACDLLDETPDMNVKMLEMPDFSKFMKPQDKQENIQQSLPEIQPNLQIQDDAVLKQMQSLGLI